MSNKDRGRCLVCDDIAIGINFGVPTCMPCKAFFRRHAVRLREQEFVCETDGDCIISYKYRRLCNYCRLAKSFRVGMQKSLILSDEERKARNKLVEINRLKRGKIPKRQCIEWMRPSSLLRITKNSVQCLSSSDQVVLTNIFHAFENTCVVAKNTRFQCFPSIQCRFVHEIFNEIGLLVPVFIEYFKHIPEFINIIIDDKIRLVKSHLSIMISVMIPLMYPVTPSNLIVSWTNAYGIDTSSRLLKRNQIIEQYNFDPILLKIILIILVLSSCINRNFDAIDMDQICDDPLSIYAAQNIYVELLWRYILSCSASEKDAVKFLNKLMMLILHIQNINAHIDSYVNSLKEEIKQMEPMMQCMWPKADNEEDITNNNIIQHVNL